MSNTNPQIEKQLDKLAAICCQKLDSEETATKADDQTIDDLLKSVLMSGYARQDGRTLQVDVESRVKDQCREPAMHRGGALSSITGQWRRKFNELAQWESRQPK